MFRAGLGTVTLFGDNEGTPATRLTLAADGSLTKEVIVLNPAEGVWARAASEGRAILLARPIRNERLRTHYEKRGVRDAMVAPIFSDSKVVGTVLIGNHLGDVATFTQDDLRMFETLVNHAGVTLDNARLVSRLQDALTRATELNRLKDDFLAMTSHELRTPLTSIQGFVKTLLRPDMATDPAEQVRYFEIIDRQTDRLAGLIDDLLVATQLEADAVRPSLSHVSVDALLTQVADELALRAGKRHIEIVRDAHLPAALSNEELLHRILSNLVENALKYSPDGTTVRVSAMTKDEGIVISIADEGAGIPDEAQEKIFDRFYQVEALQTRRVGGAGLGLYISRRLAGSLGGRLWLESTGSAGSTFCVWVPVVGPVNVGERRLELIRTA
jgi:two-component system phosphate regulon sensor histidine kinase PhoR